MSNLITGRPRQRPLGDNLANSAIRAGVATGAVAGGLTLVARNGVRPVPAALAMAGAAIGAPVFGSSVSANALREYHPWIDSAAGAAAGGASVYVGTRIAARGMDSRIGPAVAVVAGIAGAALGAGIGRVNSAFMN